MENWCQMQYVRKHSTIPTIMLLEKFEWNLSMTKKRTHMTGVIMTTAEFPLEVGEDNWKFKHKKLRKIQIDQYGQTKACYRGF